MNDAKRQAKTDQVLFCPFCREAFEGTKQCPDHDLLLVPWHELPRTAELLPENEPLTRYALVAGRGWVFLGAALTLLAFVMPMLTLAGETELHANMLRFAALRSGKLWMVPLASVAQVMILFRRRTLRGMRGVRLAVASVALMPSIALALTLRSVHAAAVMVAQRTGDVAQLTVEWGSYLVFIATLPMLYGAFRLGVTRTQEPSQTEVAND